MKELVIKVSDNNYRKLKRVAFAWSKQTPEQHYARLLRAQLKRSK